MKKMLVVLLLLLLPSLSFAQANENSRTQAVVFAHATIIDMTGAAARPDMSVVIVGDRITEIGKSNNVKPPKGELGVDVPGKFLIPGLWDMHVHAWDKNIFFPLFIANGITGVRDMFGPLPPIKQWRKEMEAGTTLGPRIVAAGPIVDGPQAMQAG